jgi:hypothetical protein
MPVTLSIKRAVELIESGYVRWTKDETTPTESLQTYFGLNTKQMQTLLKRSELKNKRTTDNSLIFEEDLEVTEEVDTITQSPTFVLEGMINPNAATTVTSSADLFN